jgi:uridine monophosphate synthetase
MPTSNGELAERILRTGQITFDIERVLKSGLKSPVYVDGRGFVSHPLVLRSIGDEMLSYSRKLKFDRIAGIPMAGHPLAIATSLANAYSRGEETPSIWIREVAKQYGTSNRIEGLYENGDTILLIDNVVTDGKSKFETVDLLGEEGLRVTDVLVLVDREQGAKEVMAGRGITLHSLFTMTEMLYHAVNRQIITPERFELVRAYLHDPLEYADNREIQTRIDEAKKTAD